MVRYPPEACLVRLSDRVWYLLHFPTHESVVCTFTERLRRGGQVRSNRPLEGLIVKAAKNMTDIRN